MKLQDRSDDDDGDDDDDDDDDEDDDDHCESGQTMAWDRNITIIVIVLRPVFTILKIINIIIYRYHYYCYCYCYFSFLMNAKMTQLAHQYGGLRSPTYFSALETMKILPIEPMIVLRAPTG